MRGGVLLLPVRPRRLPRADRLQASGRAVPEGPEAEAPQPADEEGAVAAAEHPPLRVRLRRHGAPDPPRRRHQRVDDGGRQGLGVGAAG